MLFSFFSLRHFTMLLFRGHHTGHIIRHKCVVVIGHLRIIVVGLIGVIVVRMQFMRFMTRCFGQHDVVVVEFGALSITRHASPERTSAYFICNRRVFRIVLDGVHAIQTHAFCIAFSRWIRPNEED